jgi:DNA-binding response OmpR family regulator
MGNILIVDDDPVALHFVKTILVNEGYQVNLAKDGREALQKLKEEPFDIIISDVNMPAGISGFDLAETIRDQNRLKKVSIIFLTGRREKEDVHRALKSGIDDYLVKPVDPNLLLSKVQNLMWKKEDDHCEIAFVQASIQEKCTILLKAQIISLSAQGITLKSEVAMTINKQLSIDTEIFSKIGIRTPVLRVVTSKVEAREKNTYFISTLRFIGLPALDLQKIRNWINSHHVGNDGQGNFKRA